MKRPISYTLVMINAQGASEVKYDLYSKAKIRRHIRSVWNNPKQMTARVYIDANGIRVYDGPALGFK